MRALMMGAAALAGVATLGGCSTLGLGDAGYYGDPAYRTYSQYDYNRPDPTYNGYYADRYYVQNPRYRERVLTSNDRVYVGSDGRYYCRRPDGTTGLVVGGIAGGVLGNIIAPGGSRTLGTILGAIAGGAGGAAIDRNNVRCR